MHKIFSTFKIEICYRKRYLVNQLSFYIGTYIFVSGVMLTTSPSVNIVFWLIYILTTTRVFEHFYESVKDDSIQTIYCSKTAPIIYVIMFSFITYIISLIIAIPLLIIYIKFISIKYIIFILTFYMVFVILNCIIISYVTLVYKRTAILLSIFSMYLLFNSGLVYASTSSLAMFENFNYTSTAILNYRLLIFTSMLTIFIVVLLTKMIKVNGIQR